MKINAAEFVQWRSPVGGRAVVEDVAEMRVCCIRCR